MVEFRPSRVGAIMFPGLSMRFVRAQMAAEQELFHIGDALDAINQKLVRRHPHVFGEQSAETAGDVKRIWGEVKAAEQAEKKEKRKSQDKNAGGLLGSVPRALPRRASIGRTPNRFWTSCTKSWPNSPRRGATRRPKKWKTNSGTCCSCW